MVLISAIAILCSVYSSDCIGLKGRAISDALHRLPSYNSVPLYRAIMNARVSLTSKVGQSQLHTSGLGK